MYPEDIVSATQKLVVGLTTWCRTREEAAVLIAETQARYPENALEITSLALRHLAGDVLAKIFDAYEAAGVDYRADIALRHGAPYTPRIHEEG
ncbi:hypothetical protein AB0P13_19295 [Rhodococcus pyridinivorans]|uniref:hypothetical protein n=1 Tax=Rhodococcus pyridinivorans TaxID=103816 RepID=UPI003430B623